ncbi:MAG: CapA family protein [Clostridiales bacterium]|nr:CapA family protein [Clostridiales bacterium]
MNRPSEIKARLSFWDNAKGILIFLVVFGHMLYAYQDNGEVRLIIGAVYSFHMPAFAFVSGFLSAKSKTKMKDSLVFLVVAYAVFNTLAMLYFFFIEDIPISLFVPYVSFWYLPALIVWRLLLKVVPKKAWIPGFVSVLALAVGFSGQIGSHPTISRIICFFPFFLAGAMLPWRRVLDFLAKEQRKGRLLGILSLVLALGGIVLLVPRVTSFNEYLMGTYVSPADLLNRLLILLISGFVVAAGLLLIPDREVPLLSSWGRNSLAVYLLHRFITLVSARTLPLSGKTSWIFLVAVAGTFVMMIVFGNDTSGMLFRSGIDGITKRLRRSTDAAQERKNILFRVLAILVAATVVFLSVLGDSGNADTADTQNSEIPAVHSVLTDSDRKRIDDAVSLAFVGDLVLLKGQVVAAYDDEADRYDFSEMFRYAAPYMDADFTVGVFEGPTAGPDAGYSSSDYDDGIPLHLNFPDSFAGAAQAAGIDLVTLANNHLLDKGLTGAYRTIDVLDRIGLMHTGAYRNAEEKEHIFIVEIEGLRVAFLSYTFGSNYYEDEYFMCENETITSVIAAPDSPFFEKSKSQVQEDFDRVKSAGPDVIVVLPHMGTQFIHETDHFQETWNDLFVESGADIVLGDHAHAVQPIEFVESETFDGETRQSVIVNCPGNFANSFVRFDGDATSVVKVYIEPKTGEIVCASVVPMWTHGTSDGCFRALPIFEILHNETLRSQLSYVDMERVYEVQDIVTSVMLGVSVPTDQAQDEYFLFRDGYRRKKAPGMDPDLSNTKSEQLRMFRRAATVCFIGDSVTCGSNNGGYPWYEPLTTSFPEKEYGMIASGGLTTKDLLAHFDEALREQKADLFIIAIGANDIRYRDELRCAMSAEEYSEMLEELVRNLRIQNTGADFIFIAPWPALDNDIYTTLSPQEKSDLYSAYTMRLQGFCEKNGFLFVDPTADILKVLGTEPVSKYLLDHIHPNASNGILLYSRAFIDADPAESFAVSDT